MFSVEENDTIFSPPFRSHKCFFLIMKRIALCFSGFLAAAFVIAISYLMIVNTYCIEWSDEDESVVGLFFILIWWVLTLLFGNITMAVLAVLKGRSVSDICYRFSQIWFCTPFLILLVCIFPIVRIFPPTIILVVVLCVFSSFAAAICYALRRAKEI